MQKLDLLDPKKGAAAVGRSPVDLLKAAVGQQQKLPTLPEAATKALEIANNPDASMSAFAAVIERDPALATNVLKLANSALYRVGRAIETLNQAVVRLGLRECKNLLIAVGMRSLYNAIPAANRAACELLWQHSFLVACLCRRLNRSLEFGYQGEEFSCGLSHDIGRILFAIAVADQFAALDPVDFNEGPDLLAREQSLLGTDHCAFGAWFATSNKLPASIVSAIQYHHAPARASCHQNLIGLVATADHMANHLPRAGKADGYDVKANPGWQMLAQNCDGGMKQKFEGLATTIMTEAAREASEVASATK